MVEEVEVLDAKVLWGNGTEVEEVLEPQVVAVKRQTTVGRRMMIMMMVRIP